MQYRSTEEGVPHSIAVETTVRNSIDVEYKGHTEDIGSIHPAAVDWLQHLWNIAHNNKLKIRRRYRRREDGDNRRINPPVDITLLSIFVDVDDASDITFSTRRNWRTDNHKISNR
jgi:hypothetical protein